ncbi:hypothetical protein M7I_1012 [Glarea lozoyensis 74030]|uniref:Uncharacterized protein n=1 Tax=Glarea lozoyensis (strain ATCC 74030 / MF5533) TaxID=1104152 RepID=H0EEX5_GLAL7|nr:hypothetical protein M7I_1012 [Glarea lozoyensis 74030]
MKLRFRGIFPNSFYNVIRLSINSLNMQKSRSPMPPA